MQLFLPTVITEEKGVRAILPTFTQTMARERPETTYSSARQWPQESETIQQDLGVDSRSKSEEAEDTRNENCL